MTRILYIMLTAALLMLCLPTYVQWMSTDHPVHSMARRNPEGIHPLALATVMVLSRRENVATRDAIRRYWIDTELCDRVFFVGQSCPGGSDGISCHIKSSASYEIPNSREDFPDTVTLNVTDVYHHLPRKLKLAYAWTLKFTRSRWLVKTDEDFFVNGPNLARALMEFDSSTRVAIGCIAKAERVHREGKWKEDSFEPDTYPPFPLGSCGHAVTKDVAEFIVNLDGHEFQGEDTSLGIWVKDKHDITLLNTPRFTNNGQCNDLSKAIMGHQFSANAMRACTEVHRLNKFRPA